MISGPLHLSNDGWLDGNGGECVVFVGSKSSMYLFIAESKDLEHGTKKDTEGCFLTCFG